VSPGANTACLGSTAYLVGRSNMPLHHESGAPQVAGNKGLDVVRYLLTPILDNWHKAPSKPDALRPTEQSSIEAALNCIVAGQIPGGHL